MIVDRFVSEVCSDLQVDNPEFRTKLIREIIPSAEEAMLSLSSEGVDFEYSPQPRSFEQGYTRFLMPTNCTSIKSLLVGTESKEYEILKSLHGMKHTYPMWVNCVSNVNIVYPRANAKNMLSYTIEALDYARFKANGSVNIQDYFYEVGKIFDNQNIFLKTESMTAYGIIRIRTTPNTFIQPDDYIEIQTDYGDIRINVSSQEETYYLGEDGSTYRLLTDLMNLDGLIWRSPYKYSTGTIRINSEYPDDQIINIRYTGKPLANYHFEDDDHLLDTFYIYVKLFCLKEGAQFFKMREDYITYRNEYNDKMSMLMRDTSIKDKKGKTLRFRGGTVFGKTPVGR